MKLVTPCPTKIEINEVAPRDGLQIEARFVPTEEKIHWIDALSTTGLRRIVGRITASAAAGWAFARLFVLPTRRNILPRQVRLQPVW